MSTNPAVLLAEARDLPLERVLTRRRDGALLILDDSGQIVEEVQLEDALAEKTLADLPWVAA